MFIKTYRGRLIVYMFLLIMFLSGTLVYSYQYVRDLITDEADSHFVRLMQLLNGHLNEERNELQRYSALVAQDLRLKEYMYIVTEIGGDSQPLVKLYDREFGWLPTDHRVILTRDKQVLVGESQGNLVDAVLKFTERKGHGVFYFQNGEGLEVVGVSTIKYRDNLLGYVAVCRVLNQEWFENTRQVTGGEFFLAEKGKIINSTLKSVKHNQFDFKNHTLKVDSSQYRINKIELPGNEKIIPELWFGFSENDILEKIKGHHRFMLGVIGVGVIGVLLFGLVIIRDFSRPLNRILQLTHQVASGDLPVVNKYTAKNEFDELSNHFSDMLMALREQKMQIQITQNKLEQSAITDSLTGLYNRRYLNEIFPKLLSQVEREGLSLFAIIMDLDLFKKINDNYGHMAGDQCLVSFADHLKTKSRVSDYLFRMGGEEFLILSVNKNIMEAARFAEKLRVGIESLEVVYADHHINMTVSGGISPAYMDEDVDYALEHMLSQADNALYKAKRSGRNRVCLNNALGKNDLFPGLSSNV